MPRRRRRNHTHHPPHPSPLPLRAERERKIQTGRLGRPFSFSAISSFSASLRVGGKAGMRWRLVYTLSMPEFSLALVVSAATLVAVIALIFIVVVVSRRQVIRLESLARVLQERQIGI